MGNVVDYWRLIKPRVTLAIFLLFFLATLTSVGKEIWHLKIDQTWKLTLGTFIVLTSVAGSNALNNRLDSDIDGLMGRTKHREIPSGKISTPAAQSFGFSIIALSILLALVSEYYFPLLLFIGLSSYLLLYTVILKRHNVLSVLATGPAVASPVWIGWIIGRGYLDLAGFLTGVLVMIWGPMHLWSLATVFTEDYRSASIPMLPVIIGVNRSRWFIFAFAVALTVTSISLFFFGYYGLVYLAGLIFVNLILIVFSIISILRSSGRWNWIVYKFTAPYMVIVLLLAAIDRILL